MSVYADRAQAALKRLPPALAARPRDTRGLPIPFSQAYRANGEPDFTQIDAAQVLRCGQSRLCGLCGGKLGSESSFLGGPLAASNRDGAGAYIDPPMHPACAQAALALCPHIAVQNAMRARQGPDGPWDVVAPDGMNLGKPSEWVLLTSHGFTFRFYGTQGLLFFPTPGSARRTFAYDPGTHALVEAAAL